MYQFSLMNNYYPPIQCVCRLGRAIVLNKLYEIKRVHDQRVKLFAISKTEDSSKEGRYLSLSSAGTITYGVLRTTLL